MPFIFEADEQYVFEVISQSIVPALLMLLLSLAGSLFLALCVYNDAKARGNNSAVMWAVLSGFFNIIALVYIIVAVSSKPKAVICPRCNNWIPAGYAGCPVCGLPPTNQTMPPELLEGYKRRRILFLILFIVAYVITALVTVWWLIDFLLLLEGTALYY